MIDQSKIDRLMKLPHTTATFRCSMLEADGTIIEEEHMSFGKVREWLAERAKESPTKRIQVFNECSGRMI